MLSVKEQVKYFLDGTEELIVREELEKKLSRGAPLKIKYGADPSAPDLHLGHTVPLRKLRKLQNAGHQVIFIIGDFTARVGDPSHRDDTRQMLSREQIESNAKTYQEQVFRILDPKKTTVRYNSEWFDRMTSQEFLNLASKYTVAQLIERDDFQKRFAANKPIKLVEFLYPLLQGHDSVMIHADVELGGTDQKFNLLVGRELQRDAGQEPQVVMTLPIIEGTDGTQKMSKSLGNAIAIQETAKEMFGKVMSLPDALMIRYFRYVTDLETEDVEKLEKDYTAGKIHPRDLKVSLGKKIVSLYHDEKQAEDAQRAFDQVFRDKQIPADIPEAVIPASLLKNNALDIITLLVHTGLETTRSEARRQIQQGAVKIDQKKIEKDTELVLLERELILQSGKRKFVKIRAEK